MANIQAAERGKSAAGGALEGALQRLEEIVDQETEALRGFVAIDLKEFNDRKNHALLELTRVMRHVPAGSEGEAFAARLERLRLKLELNRSVLQVHLEAVREITTTLSDAIRDSESDGTYSQSIPYRSQ